MKCWRLNLNAYDRQNLHWSVVEALGARPKEKNHTSETFIVGFGSMPSNLTKQNMSSRSSKEVDLIAVYDKISKVTQEKTLTEAQGFAVHLNIVFQHGASTIKLRAW